jgi:hypothetical protein
MSSSISEGRAAAAAWTAAEKAVAAPGAVINAQLQKARRAEYYCAAEQGHRPSKLQTQNERKTREGCNHTIARSTIATSQQSKSGSCTCNTAAERLPSSVSADGKTVTALALAAPLQAKCPQPAGSTAPMPAAGGQRWSNASSRRAAQRECQQRLGRAARMPAAGEQCWSNASSGRAVQAECQQRAHSAARMPAAERQRSVNASSGRAPQFECQPLQHSAVRVPPAGSRMPAAGGRRSSNASSSGRAAQDECDMRIAVRFRCQQCRRIAKQL